MSLNVKAVRWADEEMPDEPVLDKPLYVSTQHQAGVFPPSVPPLSRAQSKLKELQQRGLVKDLARKDGKRNRLQAPHHRPGADAHVRAGQEGLPHRD